MLDGHGQAVPRGQRGQWNKLGTEWQSHLQGELAPGWRRTSPSRETGNVGDLGDLMGERGARGDRAALTAVNSSWQQLEVVGRSQGMADGTVQSQCQRYLQQQEGRRISDCPVPGLCIWPRPHPRVPSPSIRELSLWLSSTSAMLTRNCRWSRRTSKVRVPSVRSMSCWVSARDMSSLATPLIWRGQSGRPQRTRSWESRPQESPARMGCSDCRLPGPCPAAPAQPQLPQLCPSWPLSPFLAASQWGLLLHRGNKLARLINSHL